MSLLQAAYIFWPALDPCLLLFFLFIHSIPRWNNYWSIDPVTGVLSPVRPLDTRSSAGGSQQIQVAARNRWSADKSAGSVANVNIRVRPGNRYAPHIHITHAVEVRFHFQSFMFHFLVAVCSIVVQFECRDPCAYPSNLFFTV